MKLFTRAFFGMTPFYMSEDAPAGTAAVETNAPNDAVVAPTAPAIVERPATDTSADEQAPADPVTLTVPTEHADLMQRALALLERGEAWLKDNIEAGISHFESMFKDEDNNV